MWVSSSRAGLACLVSASALVVPWLCVSEGGRGAVAAPAGLVRMPDEEAVPELALLMGDLQRLTHKLALSADAGNAELAAFYLHETGAQLSKIQVEAPEYEGLPVAVLIDRMAHPALADFGAVLAGGGADRAAMLACLDGVIQSCNACHLATRHGFIRITRGTEVNPFNQSFAP